MAIKTRENTLVEIQEKKGKRKRKKKGKKKIQRKLNGTK